MALAEAHLAIKKLLGVKVWGEDAELCAWVTAQHLLRAQGVTQGVCHTGCHTGQPRGFAAPSSISIPEVRAGCLLSAKGWLSQAWRAGPWRRGM